MPGEKALGTAANLTTVVLDVSGLHYATEKNVVETVLGRRPGVDHVEANPVSQTATVTFDQDVTSVRQLARWIEECGYHCAGQSVPTHLCDPMVEPAAHEGHQPVMRSPDEAMGHGGHARMSMDGMVRDMRNRFLVA